MSAPITTPDEVQSTPATDQNVSTPVTAPASNLPTIPQELPAELQEYAAKTSIAAYHVSELSDELDKIRKHGANLLRQHSAVSVATSEFESSDSDERKAYDAESADIERLRAELDAREEKAEAAREAAIQALVTAQASTAGVDLGVAKFAYEKAYKILTEKATIKSLGTMGSDAVMTAYATFASKLPTAEELQRGERKRTSAKVSGTAADSRPGSKKSFAWWELNGKRLTGTTYGDVAREIGVAAITLGRLTDQLLDHNDQGDSTLQDGKVYSFTITVTDADKGTSTDYAFRCLPIKRTLKTAGNAVTAPEVNSAPESAQATGEDNSTGPEFSEVVL